MSQYIYLLPENEVTKALIRATKIFQIQSKLIQLKSYVPPYAPILIDEYSLRNSFLASSTQEVVYKLRLIGWPNHLIVLSLRSEPIFDILGITVVYSLADILKLPFTELHALNEFELRDARRPALLNKIEKWIHDLKSKNEDILNEIFMDIEASISTISDISSIDAKILNSTKNITELKNVLLSIKNSIQRRSGYE